MTVQQNPSLAFTVSILFTEQFHGGVYDDTGKPYAEHPIQVLANLLKTFRVVSVDMQHAALLHDVLEDTEVTADELAEMGYTPRVIHMVELLSTDLAVNHDLSYRQRIEKLIASGDVDAMKIKFADNMHNSDPARLLVYTKDRAERKRQKYQESMNMLKAQIPPSHFRT